MRRAADGKPAGGRLQFVPGRRTVGVNFVWLAPVHHLSALGIKRVTNDPLGRVERMIIFVSELTEAFGNSLENPAVPTRAAHSLSSVRAEIVEDNDVARPNRGDKSLFHVEGGRGRR